MSTSLDATNWCLMMGCPNCRRFLAKRTQCRATAAGRRQPWQDQRPLPRHRVREETCPPPSAPKRFSAGTSQSSSVISAIWAVFSPHLSIRRTTWKPRVSSGSESAHPCRPFPRQRRRTSPSRQRPRHWSRKPCDRSGYIGRLSVGASLIPNASDPASGSDTALAPIHSPAQRRQEPSLLLFGSKGDERHSTVHICALRAKLSPLSRHANPRLSRAPAMVTGSAPRPPYSTGTGKPLDPDLGTFAPSVAVKLRIRVSPDQIFVQFAPRELDDLPPELLLLGRPRKVHAGESPPSESQFAVPDSSRTGRRGVGECFSMLSAFSS